MTPAETEAAIAFLAAGASGATVYLHMSKREKDRDRARSMSQDKSYRASWPLGVADWLVGVALRGVVYGVTAGAVAWSALKIVLWALGVVQN